MKLERLPSSADVARAVARLLVATAHRREAVLVLPAGGTPLPLYRELTRGRARGELDLSRAHVFQLDELVGVAAVDPRSFQSFLRHSLLDPLGRRAPRGHLLDGAAQDPVREIERHAQELERLGGADLVLLGIGRNGHVAFNEPGSTRDAPSRVVDLAPETLEALRGVFPESELPHRGMTLGLREIAGARRVVVIATGPSKAAILGSVLGRAPTPERPASLLLGHADLRVFADPEAGRLVTPS